MPDSNIFDGPEGLDWRRVVRYLADECTPDERARIDAWVERSDEARAYLESLRVLGTEAAKTLEGETDPDRMWAAAQARLGIRAAGGASVRPLLRREQVRGGARTPSVHGIAWAIAACAVLALVVVGRTAHRSASGWRTYATVAGQRETVTLADGTRFSLGPESRLRVPVDFGVGRRAVDLEGEGYFRVVHDSRHPFSVRAANATVTDVGTAFDVRAYADDRAVRIAVAEGEVGVAAGAGAVHEPSLRAGDVAEVADSTIAVTHGADVAASTAWMDGTLAFRETPLRTVIRDLSRAYGADVTLGDSALADVPFTATLPAEPLQQALEIVASAVGGQVEHAGTRYRLVVPGSPFRGSR